MRFLFWCVLLLSLAGCSHGPGPKPSPTSRPVQPVPQGAPGAPTSGLSFRLSPGQEDGAAQGLPEASATPMADKDLEALLTRLPAIKRDPSDQKAFAMRESSLGPPSSAKTIQIPFPAPSAGPPPVAASNGPLKVTSCAPKGDIEMAPHLTVSFNQPMVPIGSLEEVEARALPVKLTPQPEGKWRWLGTDTLMFVPKIRFPMATEYKVEIPAGVVSATGNKLAKGESFSFKTPPMKMESSYPQGGPHDLHPLIFLRFNQDIDRAALLPFVKLTTAGKETPLRLASPDEVALDKTTRSLTDNSPKDRWLVLAPSQGLIAGNTYAVTVQAGAPSKEGPLPTRAPQSFTFSTYDPLHITYSSGESGPGSPWVIQFNNELDASKFDSSQVKVEPQLVGQKSYVSSSSLIIQGRGKARTTYKVTVPASLADRYGQTLKGPDSRSFKVIEIPTPPSFRVDGSNIIVLDPQGPRQLTCQVTNYPRLKVTAWRVKPSDWQTFQVFSGQQYSQRPLTPPGQLAFDGEIETHVAKDEPTEVKVDISKALDKDLGQVVVRIEPLPRPDPKKYPYHPLYVGWIQSTQIGLDAMLDSRGLTTWTSDLATGKALAGVEVKMEGSGESQTSDQQGLANLKVHSGSLLVARKGEDVAVLPGCQAHFGGTTQTPWYLADDRHLYRPGETVNLKGWIRQITYGPEGDVLATSARQVRYSLRDSRGNEILKGETQVGRLGGFSLNLPLPKTVNLGHCNLQLSSEQGSHYHSFQVEEFRRPEFEVSASASPSSSVIGEHSTVTATASYFAGGPLPNAKVDWSVSATPTSYSPPNWAGFTFGNWTPWWNYRCWWVDQEFRQEGPPQSLQTRTDSKGKGSLRVNFVSVDPPQPSTVVTHATVQDVNRQTWTTQTSLLVHPCSLYVGLKSARTFVERGQDLELSAIVTDIEGKAVAGKAVQLKVYRLDWEGSWGEPRVKHADETVQTLTSADKPLTVKVPVKEGGVYQVEASIQDDQNRRNRSEMTMWVAGGKQPPSRNVAQESLTLVPSKKEYSATDTAEVLVQAPFAPAELVVTTRRNGLAKLERISAPTGAITVKIPLKEAYVPGVTVQVDAVGSKVRTDDQGQELAGKPTRPAYASGNLVLNISQATRQLQVTVKAQAQSLQPGGSTKVDVDLKDWEGKPVSGDVAVIAVDDSVLAMTGYDPADPLGSFCAMHSPDVGDVHLRQFVLLSSGQAQEQPVARSRGFSKASGGARYEVMEQSVGLQAPGKPQANGVLPVEGDVVIGQQRKSETMATSTPPPDKPSQPAFKVRTNFTPLALFLPAVATDSGGHAVVDLKLPDNLTRYRLIALAAAGDKQFGKGESSLTARQPLMIRPSPPRFLNFGDRFELPVVLQNQTDKAMQVALACRSSNAHLGKADGEKAGYTVQVPANDRVEVRIPAAADQAGTARFQFGASAGEAGDAAEVSLPVWTPATSEAFATYGVVDKDGAISQPIQKPEKVFPQFGGLTVTTSSTALAELTDAFIRLQTYPFECSEQISSRMLAAAALRDVLYAFQAPGMPSRESLAQSMTRDLARLKGQQNFDGGWDYWKRDEPSVPYVSIHVAHTLVRVRDKGYPVDPRMLSQAVAYLRLIETHLDPHYSVEMKRSLRAYALYVLNLEGHPDFIKARALAAEMKASKGLTSEAMGWLLPTLAKDKAAAATVAEIHRYLDNHITQTASSAHFSSNGYSDQGYLILYSDTRAEGILLESLIQTRPNHPIIPKLVRGLLDRRSDGHWGSTQDNCWVLLALDKYFHKFESVTPDFVARVWLGKNFAGEQTFKGRSKDDRAIEIPMAQVEGPLTLAKQGKGRLYYRIGLRYAPQDFKQLPADYGFCVQRLYEGIKDNRDVTRDQEGTWHVKAGAEVKVTVTMKATTRRTHVALVDPLPAGFEAINPALLGAAPEARTRGTGGRYDRWNYGWNWFNHQNLRDERVEAFTQLLWEGVYTYTYTARATTPGTFVVPPAKAEEMYHPETFGRSGSDKVVVEK